MNLKQCKKLRRLAERSTVSMPLCTYEINSHGVVRVYGSTTRGVYRALKKAVR